MFVDGSVQSQGLEAGRPAGRSYSPEVPRVGGLEKRGGSTQEHGTFNPFPASSFPVLKSAAWGGEGGKLKIVLA